MSRRDPTRPSVVRRDIAEDLELITPELDALRDLFRLPGTRPHLFAFDGSRDNPTCLAITPPTLLCTPVRMTIRRAAAGSSSVFRWLHNATRTANRTFPEP